MIGIFGTGRCGSTMLLRLLDGVPNYFALPVDFDPMGLFSDLAIKGKISRISHLHLNPNLMGLDLKVDSKILWEYYSAFEKDLFETYGQEIKKYLNPSGISIKDQFIHDLYKLDQSIMAYFKAVHLYLNSGLNETQTIFKTTEICCIDDYAQRFPNMKFIHIVRNPIDTYQSYVRGFRWRKYPDHYFGFDNLMSIINIKWLEHAKAIERWKSHSNHFVVRYEDIVQNGPVVMKDLCQKLNLEFSPINTKLTIFGGFDLIKIPRNSSSLKVKESNEIDSKRGGALEEEDVLYEFERKYIFYKLKVFLELFEYASESCSKWSVLALGLIPRMREFKNWQNVRGFFKGFYSLFYRRYHLIKNLI